MPEIASTFYNTDYFHTMENRYWMNAHAERIEDISAFLPQGKTVLDYGAGSGFFAYQASQRGNTVTAWDYSEAARVFIREHYGSFLTVPEEPNGQFECLFLFDVIEHIGYEEQSAFIQKLKGFLTKGGMCLMSTDNQDSWFGQSTWGKLLQRVDKRLTVSGRTLRIIRKAEYARPYQKKYHDSHIGLLGRDQLVELFAKNGLKLIAEKHGFLFRSPLSSLIAKLFQLRPLHSIYHFQVDS